MLSSNSALISSPYILSSLPSSDLQFLSITVIYPIDQFILIMTCTVISSAMS